MTASSSTPKQLYLLPGEHDRSSSIVHHHGMVRSSPRAPETSLTFTPRIYKPQENDFVIGVIIARTADLFVVDINSTDVAILPTVSFDRGCLPPRDVMNRLSAVYARVVCADPWTQAELSCGTFPRTRKTSDFGLLDYGTIVRCSLGLRQRLQQSPLFDRLSRLMKNFEYRLCANGMLWYTTDTINSTIAVKNIIHQYERENDIEYLIDLYRTITSDFEQQVMESDDTDPCPGLSLST